MFFENLRIALSSIYSNKMRSLLTTLGIVIGVLSVTLMGTLISGLDRSFEKSMSWLGKDILYISRYEWFSDMEWWEVKNRRKIQLNYVDEIYNKSKYAIAVSPVMQKGATLSYNNNNTITEIFGTNVDYMETISTNINIGRFFTEGEDRSGKRVTVIGEGIKKSFFQNENPIGNYIRIDGIKFKIIGVLEGQGKFLGLFSVDNQAIIPIGAYTRLFSKRGFTRISVKVNKNKIDKAKENIISVMRQIRGLKPLEKNDFAINQTKVFEKEYKKLKIAIGGTGLFITILSLVVGGIGIMNIMFVSVKERTKEIGIRKALGATNRMILTQFLMESIIICFIGGTIGLTLAYTASIIVKNFFPSILPVWLASTSMFLSIIVGILSGLIPSYQAARMNPIDALRYE